MFVALVGTAFLMEAFDASPIWSVLLVVAFVVDLYGRKV